MLGDFVIAWDGGPELDESVLAKAGHDGIVGGGMMDTGLVHQTMACVTCRDWTGRVKIFSTSHLLSSSSLESIIEDGDRLSH